MRAGVKLYEKEAFLLMSNTGCIKVLDKQCLQWRDLVLDARKKGEFDHEPEEFGSRHMDRCHIVQVNSTDAYIVDYYNNCFF
jgi:hypothetical protein